jgi:VWFA-related protein
MVLKISSPTTIAVSLLLTLLFASGSSIRAQQSESPSNSVKINTDLVVTWAQIFNEKDGSVVKGLKIDDFLLREEGKPQQISLMKESQPYSVAILLKVLETCGGDAYKLAPEWSFKRGGEALRQFGNDAEIALMAWDHAVTLVQPMTRDHKLIVDRLEDRDGVRNMLRPKSIYPDGGPAEYSRPGEAIYQAARYLEKNASPGRRKIIIVIDVPAWLDKYHLHTAAEVKEMLEKTGTTVYGLYQWYDLSEVSKSQRSNRGDGKRRSGGTLEEFVEQTGGSILMGKPEESDDQLIKLTGLIRSSYTIGYYPENSDFDGSFRRISLELSPAGKIKAGKVKIKTRDGYRALRPSPPAVAEITPDVKNRAEPKDGRPNSVVILVQGMTHCCHEPFQSFTELSIQKNREALRQLGDDAEIALMAWDYDAALVQPLTNDQNLIAQRLKDRNSWINALRPRSMTSTGDLAEFSRPGAAIYRAAEYLEKNASPGRRKSIIIISQANWLDKAHPHTAAEVKAILERTGAAVYGLYEDYWPENVAKFQKSNQKDKERRSGGTIEEFVEQTGGSILVGKPEKGDELLLQLTGLIRSLPQGP